ncbi:transposable element p transposase [Plakobranchus ocellatus]|uniref:Transposable element p transposase n=1 Tax=Plakobranchus ocellatus TaxID=259542 RepID=A0AAV3Z802_9GAST|nr:transposable element p transposase [Plakobranchus ocellatus]
MPRNGNVCAVAFDKMGIKTEMWYNVEEDNVEGLEDYGNERSATAADHALEFMVRGILKLWKQAVGYALTTNTIPGPKLKFFLLKCIDKLVGIGLNVKDVICDLGSNNAKVVKFLRLPLTSSISPGTVDTFLCFTIHLTSSNASETT